MFLPIEPPRPPPNKRESYARRSHQFSPSIDVPTKPGLFRKASVADPGIPKVPPPDISIDGRLPDPAIVTCNEPLPLRILITKKNQSPATIFLQMLNIELIGYTSIRAHELRRQETTSWMVLSLSNMRMPLGNPMGNEGSRDGSRVFEVDSKLWKQHPIHNTVSPSFETCNLSRQYALDVKLGLSWGSPGNINVRLIPPQMSCDENLSRSARAYRSTYPYARSSLLRHCTTSSLACTNGEPSNRDATGSQPQSPPTW